MLFITSALMSWYQGSNLIDNLMNGNIALNLRITLRAPFQITNIYQIDFFIYGKIFHPTAFIVMLVSLLYMLVLLLHILFTRTRR